MKMKMAEAKWKQVKTRKKRQQQVMIKSTIVLYEELKMNFVKYKNEKMQRKKWQSNRSTNEIRFIISVSCVINANKARLFWKVVQQTEENVSTMEIKCWKEAAATTTTKTSIRECMAWKKSENQERVQQKQQQRQNNEYRITAISSEWVLVMWKLIQSHASGELRFAIEIESQCVFMAHYAEERIVYEYTDRES